MPISANNGADTQADNIRVSGDTFRTDPETVLPLAAAARVLKLQPDALRKRIERGTARGYKEGGRWLVVVDTLDRNTTPKRDTRPDRTGQGDVEIVRDVYERLLSAREELQAYRLLSEQVASTRREAAEAEEHYKAQIAELQQEKAALEARLVEMEKPGLWRRLFGGKRGD